MKKKELNGLKFVRKEDDDIIFRFLVALSFIITGVQI